MSVVGSWKMSIKCRFCFHRTEGRDIFHTTSIDLSASHNLIKLCFQTGCCNSFGISWESWSRTCFILSDSGTWEVHWSQSSNFRFKILETRNEANFKEHPKDIEFHEKNLLEKSTMSGKRVEKLDKLESKYRRDWFFFRLISLGREKGEPLGW